MKTQQKPFIEAAIDTIHRKESKDEVTEMKKVEQYKIPKLRGLLSELLRPGVEEQGSTHTK